MVVIDTIYLLLVLVTGIIVARNVHKNGNNDILTSVIAAFFIIVSIKNLLLLYFS
jgi:hypothetical protein